VRVGVLGAGVMGVSVSILLARAGVSVTLFDGAQAPLQGASRWNEGKIHLGFLYAADPTLQTARSVIEGGLSFAPLMRELIGQSLPDVTLTDDLYIVHKDSVVSADAVGAYYRRVAEMVRDHPKAKACLADASRASIRSLSASELSAIVDPSCVVAGFACPERSVSTRALSDLLMDAARSEGLIEQRLGAHVFAVTPDDGKSDPWRVSWRAGEEAQSEAFDVVVNALWHGRIAVDETANMQIAPGWSHRYRVSAFVRTRRVHPDLPSAVVATGPFGDVKNYNGRDFYVSWYPAGLLAEGETLLPPAINLAALDRAQVQAGIESGLSSVLPWVKDIFADAEKVEIEGGYVFAMGKGALDDPRATVHRRDRFGIARRGNYISVDTGKYSSAPLLATRVASAILGA